MTERCVYNSRKLLGFIMLDLCVNVHRNFAVLVAREVLNRFGIDRGIYQMAAPYRHEHRLEVPLVARNGLLAMITAISGSV